MSWADAVVAAGAVRVARRVGHRHVGEAHVLAGILEGPSGAGRQALEAAGLTVAAVDAELRSGRHGTGEDVQDGTVSFGPARALLARAEGVAIALGVADVRAQDVLVALLWHAADTRGVDLLRRCGVTTAAVRDALVAAGVAVPSLPLPEAVELVYGPEVFGPVDRFDEVMRHLAQVLGAHWNWSWNITDDGRFVFQGEEAAGIPDLVLAVLDPGDVEVVAASRHSMVVDARAPHGGPGTTP